MHSPYDGAQESALDAAKARCAALLIVDAQNDFIDGSLAVRNCPAHQEGSEIIPVINQLRSLPLWKHVAWSLDSHPPGNILVFVEQILKNCKEQLTIICLHLYGVRSLLICHKCEQASIP